MADVSISVFGADILHMENNLHLLDGIPAYSLHIDIMDGHFVPLCGFNQMWIRSIGSIVPLKKDFHFMAYVSKEMLAAYMCLKPDRITIHAEAGMIENNISLLNIIKDEGIEAGIALSPQTSAEELNPYISVIDDVLIMSTEPGREKSSFLETTYCKIGNVYKIRQESNCSFSISIDGGLSVNTAELCVKSGADRIVLGRAFFESTNRKEIIDYIKKI